MLGKGRINYESNLLENRSEFKEKRKRKTIEKRKERCKPRNIPGPTERKKQGHLSAAGKLPCTSYFVVSPKSQGRSKSRQTSWAHGHATSPALDTWPCPFHNMELNSSRSINSCDRSTHSGSRTTLVHGYPGPFYSYSHTPHSPTFFSFKVNRYLESLGTLPGPISTRAAIREVSPHCSDTWGRAFRAIQVS